LEIGDWDATLPGFGKKLSFAGFLTGLIQIMGKSSKLQFIATENLISRLGDQNQFFHRKGLEIASFWTPHMRKELILAKRMCRIQIGVIFIQFFYRMKYKHLREMIFLCISGVILKIRQF